MWRGACAVGGARRLCWDRDECEQPQRQRALEVATTLMEERSSIDATQLERRESSRSNSIVPPPSRPTQGAEGDRACIWRRSSARSTDAWSPKFPAESRQRWHLRKACGNMHESWIISSESLTTLQSWEASLALGACVLRSGRSWGCSLLANLRSRFWPHIRILSPTMFERRWLTPRGELKRRNCRCREDPFGHEPVPSLGTRS